MEALLEPDHVIQANIDGRLYFQSASRNPLEQSLIVHELSKYLSSDDPKTFKAFRQVCHLWRNESQIKWTHYYGTLIICSNKIDPLDIKHESTNRKVIQLEEFRQRYSNPKDALCKYPYKKYELRCWDLQPYHFNNEEAQVEIEIDIEQPIDVQVEDSTWFWNTFSPLIKHLTFFHCNSFGIISPLSEDILKALRNLTNFKIIGGIISPEGLAEIERRFHEQHDFIEHPKLKTLHIELLLPEKTFFKMTRMFTKSAIYLQALTIRRLSQIRFGDIYEYKIGHFATRLMQQRGKQMFTFDTLDLIEYASFNPPNFPNNLDGIADITGVVECLSVNLRRTKASRLVLDLFLNPLSKPIIMEEIPALSEWKDLQVLNIFGSITCDEIFWEEMETLKVLRCKIGKWNGWKCREKFLRYLEGNEIRKANIPRKRLDWNWRKVLSFNR